MTVTNLLRNPSVEVDLSNYTMAYGSLGSIWRDTSSHHQTSGTGAVASLTINNATATQTGVTIDNPTLAAGTYAAAAWVQERITNSDSALIVRRASDGFVLFEGHVNPSNTWSRPAGFFSVSSSTQVEFIVGVGIYSAAAAGSSRFDEFLLCSVGAAGISTTGMTVPDYFDGGTPSTASTTYAWTGTANNSTSTATPVGGGSYQSWNLLFREDFSSGSVPNPTDWYAQNGYKGTGGYGNRVGALATVSGGFLHLTTSGDNISGVNSRHPITYGRWRWRAKKDSRSGYSPANFGWSDRDVWNDGELDLWEGDSNDHITSFMHQANTGSPNLQVGPHLTYIDTTQFHIYEIQWLPNSVTYLVDDQVQWTITDTKYIPTNPMKWVGQIEVKVPGGTGTGSGTVRPNYPQAYATPWEQTIDWFEVYTASTSVNHHVLGSGIETIPNNGPGAPSQFIDTAVSTVHHFATAVENTAPDADTAVGSVPGQADNQPPPVPSVIVTSCPRWILESASGKQVELTNFVNDAEVVRGMSGWAMPPNRIKRDVIPFQPGQLTRMIVHDMRTLNIPLVIRSSDLPALERAIGVIVRAADPVNGTCKITRISAAGKASTLYAEITDGLKGDNRGAYGVPNEVPTLKVECPDPYWYNDVVTKGWGGSPANNWFPFWRPDGSWLSPSAIFNDVYETVAADVAVQPIWTIIGPGTNPVLTNLDTGETVALTATLADGDKVVIDTRLEHSTVIGPDGSNWFPNLTQHDLWALSDGLNHFSLSMTGATSKSYLSVSYQPRTLLPTP